MSTRRFNETPEQAIKRNWHEHGDGGVTVHSAQDVSEIIAENKFDFNERGGSRWKFFQNHVARIPTSLYFSKVREGLFGDRADPEDKNLKAWLNDSDNSVWRTRPGKV